MNRAIYDAQFAEGLANVAKSMNDLNEGDFLVMYEHGSKNENGPRGIFRDIAGEWMPYQRLTKIQGIIRVATDADLLGERFDNPNEGGSATDAADEGEGYAPEVVKTFYTLVTLAISDESGRVIGFDREGYCYNRYCLFTTDYATMWADVIAEERAKVEEWNAARIAEAEREDAQTQAEFDEFCEGLNESDSLKVTLRKLLAKFGISAKVNARSLHCSNEYAVTIITSEADRDNAREIVEKANGYRMPVRDKDGYSDSYRPMFQNKYGHWGWIQWEVA